MDTITIRHGLSKESAAEAVALYYEAFSQKFKPLMSEEEAQKILPALLNPDQVITAWHQGRLAGLVGIQHGRKPLFRISVCPLMRHLGLLRGLFVALVMRLFHRPFRSKELLLDGICVAASVRGMGVGTRLLEAAEEFAKNHHYLTIRLDVVDTNPRARHLYERLGYRPMKSHRHPLARRLMGFSQSTTMIKTLI